MSETLAKITKFREKCERAVARLQRKCLRELLDQCEPHQIAFFNKLYKSVDTVPLDKISWAIQQVERTLVKNDIEKVANLLGIEGDRK